MSEQRTAPGEVGSGGAGSALPRGRPLVLAVWAVVAAAAAGGQESPRLLEVPRPYLGGMEPAVREQLAEARERVESMGESPAADAEALGRAFGDLGELYLLYDLVPAAAASLENASRLLPDEARWPHLLGTLYEHERELEQARRWYETARELDADYLPTRLRLGKVLVLAGESREAREVLESVVDDSPAASPIVAAAESWLGRLALREKDYATAVAHLERALETQPEATALHYPLSQAHRGLGNGEKMRAHIELRGDTEISFPDPWALEVRERATGMGALLLLARVAMREGRLELAEARVREAIELAPESALPRRYLGDLFIQRGRWREARQALAEAVRLDPDDVGQRMGLAGVLRALGRDREMVQVLDKVLELAPDFPPAWAEAGAALARLGEDHRAEEALRRALQLDPEDEGVRWLHALVLERLGRSEEARGELARVVAGRPDFAEARYRLAALLVADGDDAAALPHLEAAVRLAPSYVEARAMLARLLGRQGRYREAAEHQAWVVELGPEEAESHLLLATARILGGELSEAKQGLLEGLERHPEDPRIADALARVLSGAPDAEVRDGATALELATAVYEDFPTLQHAETLAMALAEVGRFEDAVALQQRVVGQLEAAAEDRRLERARRHLERYRNGQPVREPWRKARPAPP